MTRQSASIDDGDLEETKALAQVYRALLTGYSAIAPQAASRQQSDLRATFELLLNVFANASVHADAADRRLAGSEAQAFNALLTKFSARRQERRKRQEASAEDFNLLQVLQVTHKEVRHSMVLAWMLDHDLDRLGTHAQGNLGLRLFLNEIGLPAHYADRNYWVRREVAGDESIVDVEIGARGAFLIHVENKIWSTEGTDQTTREWADLQRRASSLGIDPAGASVHALFLTPMGAKPSNPRFLPITWRQMVKVLERFAEFARPLDVKLFAAHYAKIVNRFILGGGSLHEGIDEDAAIE